MLVTRPPRPTHHEAVQAVKTLLRYVGEDPDREGLLDTPERVLRAYSELLAGYDRQAGFQLKTFADGVCDEMVVVKGIEFTSFCEHHWLPFSGVAHVGYLPDTRIVGLSKIPRLVDVFAKRLQVQERMTQQVVDALQEYLAPKGCGCVVVASHSCMSCRGVRKQNATMTTSALRGAFKADASTRAEFLSIVRG
jgi:GTP cyclohydrolase I